MRRILKSLCILALIGGTVASPMLRSATGALLPARSIVTLESPVTENFDSLAEAGASSTTPAGWGFAETGSTADSNYTAEDGSIDVGDTYSYGTLLSAERALGQRRVLTNASTIGAAFKNDTGAPIQSLNMSFIGELWHLAEAGRLDRMDFQYSQDATSLTTGLWIDLNTLDFTSPVTTGSTGARDGNVAPNRTSVSGELILSPLNPLGPGDTIFIRWLDIDATGDDDGLAIDNFSLTAFGDTDNDGVSDSNDDCPGTPDGEFVNAQGCSGSQIDDDGDGVPNIGDECNDTPDGEDVDAKGCGQSQKDDDSDDVNNADDVCPGTPANATVDANGCAPSQLDDDEDGVHNGNDQCPNTPSGTNVNAEGCPDADDDGVADDDDSCADTAPGATVDESGCSEAQKDDDEDSVSNADDDCPGTPANAPVDANGCPLGPPLDCGRVLTTNYTLNQDMNCDGDGLIVGKKKIKIDLNGFDLTGNGSTGVGVKNSAGRGRVKIFNSSASPSVVSGFDVGIISGGARSVVRNIEVANNASDGILIVRGKEWKVKGNDVHDNGFEGIEVQEGNKGNIIDNRSNNNGGIGILVSGFAFAITISDNTVNDNTGRGIVAPNRPDTKGSGNEVSGNDNPQSTPARLRSP